MKRPSEATGRSAMECRRALVAAGGEVAVALERLLGSDGDAAPGVADA